MGNQVINLVAIIVFPLAMIFGALWDLTTMTIPNWLAGNKIWVFETT